MSWFHSYGSASTWMYIMVICCHNTMAIVTTADIQCVFSSCRYLRGQRLLPQTVLGVSIPEKVTEHGKIKWSPWGHTPAECQSSDLNDLILKSMFNLPTHPLYILNILTHQASASFYSVKALQRKYTPMTLEPVEMGSHPTPMLSNSRKLGKMMCHWEPYFSNL